MKSRRRDAARAALAALAAAVACAAVPGCGARGKSQELTIHRRLEGEPKTLNPLLITADYDQVVLSLISRNLLDYDEKLNLVPGLAESVEPDAAHLAYTVRLREGPRWEDGSPITADDVVYTVRALMDPKTPSLNRRGFFEGFLRAEKVDARTAKVVFEAPYAARRDAFNLPLLPARLYEGTDLLTNPRNRNPLANGPFRLARWDASTIELVRNTQYLGEKAPAEKVVFRVVPEGEAAFQALLVGQLDESRLTFKMRQRIEELKDTAPAKNVLYEELAYSYVGWNNRNPLFSDARVRRALTMLMDRETIVRTLYGGLGKLANGPVPPGLWSYDPSLAPWPYDRAAAEALLDEAGWKRGQDGARSKGGKSFSFELLIGGGSDTQRQIAELAEQSFQKAGLAMSIRPMEWAAFNAKVDEGDFEACALAMQLDPNPDLAPNFHTSQFPPNGLNSVFYSNPRADAIMDELRGTFDRERARELYRELQRVIHEDEPVSFLFTPSTKWAVAKRMEDVQVSPIGMFLVWPGGAAWRPVRVKSAG